MARSRFMLSSSVVLSDTFLAMSPEAQALNTVLNAEADVTGRILGIQRIVRGSGLGADALAELYANGYLLKVGNGDTYIVHAWVHNKFDKRMWERMADCEPYTSGELVFVGDEGRSAYCLAQGVDESSGERRSSVDEPTCNSNGNGNCNGNGNPMGTETQWESNSTEKQSQGEGEHGEGEASLPPCPKCGEPLRDFGDGYLACDSCRGIFEGGQVWGT